MIRHIQLSPEFSALPYLPKTMLWQRFHKKGLKLSLDMPNVVVGPNGSGKTSLLTLLSIQALTHFSGATSLDDNYTRSGEADSYWSERTWRNDPAFLPGAKFDTDNAPALFYRPGHLVGNEVCVATAMVCGYFDEAREYGNTVKAKSSGQGCQALLVRAQDALTSPELSLSYGKINWSCGEKIRDLSKLGYVGPWDYRAEVLKSRRDAVDPAAMPMIMLDEPEQSLDARAELALWQTIANADCATRQVIVASHSLFPILHPDRFNIIEAEPGYAADLRAQMLA